MWSDEMLIGSPLAIMSLAAAEPTELAIPENVGGRTNWTASEEVASTASGEMINLVVSFGVARGPSRHLLPAKRP